MSHFLTNPYGWLFIASLLISFDAGAHAILVKSEPQQEATVAKPPSEVNLWFNEGVGEQYAALAITNGEGKRVDNQDARLGIMDRSLLTVTLPQVPPGKYSVRYRVQSADGHIVSGKYFFTIQSQTP
jgi:methionine-rich copper-binding protein CopC